MAFLSAIVGILNAAGVRIDRSLPALIKLGTGLVGSRSTNGGVDVVEIAVDTAATFSPDAPLRLTGTTLSIDAASGSTRGTLSTSFFNLLNGATTGNVDAPATLQGVLPVRDGNGDIAYRVVKAVQAVEVGNTAAKARIQLTTPTALGHLQIDPATGRGYLFIDGTATEILVAKEMPRQITWTKSAPDAAANTQTDEFTFAGGLDFDVEITGARFFPSGNLTADNTNYAGLNLSARDPTNTLPADSLFSLTTQVTGLGNFTNWIPVTLPISGGSYTLQAGWQLTFEIPKVSAGVVVPAGTLVLDYSPA